MWLVFALCVALSALCWLYRLLHAPSSMVAKVQLSQICNSQLLVMFGLLVQVQGMNLLHTLVAGCLSYREWLERRDMLVSTIRIQHPGQTTATDTACRLYSNINCCRTKPLFSTASLASQLCWELDLPIISWRLWLWHADWQPEMLNCCRCGVTAGSHRVCHADCQTMSSFGWKCSLLEWNPTSMEWQVSCKICLLWFHGVLTYWRAQRMRWAAWCTRKTQLFSWTFLFQHDTVLITGSQFIIHFVLHSMWAALLLGMFSVPA